MLEDASGEYNMVVGAASMVAVQVEWRRVFNEATSKVVACSYDGGGRELYDGGMSLEVPVLALETDVRREVVADTVWRVREVVCRRL